MRKIIRKRFSAEFFKMMCGADSEKHFKVTEDGLPEDADMIHLVFDLETRSIDCFFISELEGTEIQEGQSLFTLPITSPTFKVLECQQPKEDLK